MDSPLVDLLVPANCVISLCVSKYSGTSEKRTLPGQVVLSVIQRFPV